MSRSGGLWPAIAWAEVFLFVGLAAVGLAVASTFRACDFLGGCAPGREAVGAEAIVLLVVSGAAAATGMIAASVTSGWPGARAFVQGAAAVVAGAAALVLGARAAVALVDEYLPALVLAVGVAGTIAIRASSSRAIVARVVVLAIFVVLALGMANAGAVVVGLALLTLPAIGAVESALGPTESG